MVKTMAQTDLLRELDQVVVGELNRHEKVAREWFPHDYVPWSEGRSFDGLMGGDPWRETPESRTSPARP
jgi:acyl-[acyl-carrier-protein] desaturase